MTEIPTMITQAEKDKIILFARRVRALAESKKKELDREYIEVRRLQEEALLMEKAINP